MNPQYHTHIKHPDVSRRQSSGGLERRASVSGLSCQASSLVFHRRASLGGLATINERARAPVRDGSKRAACCTYLSPARTQRSSLLFVAPHKPHPRAAGRRSSHVDLSTIKRVHFSDDHGMQLSTTHRMLTSHYPTPIAPKQLEQSKSIRRFPIEDIELFYSDNTMFPPSRDDYVVLQLARRNDVVIAGPLECKEIDDDESNCDHNSSWDTFVGVDVDQWGTYWAVLCAGALMLQPVDNFHQESEKIPLRGCKLLLADVHMGLFDLHYVSHGRSVVKRLKCASTVNGLLWWCALQLASVAGVESVVMDRVDRNPSPMSDVSIQIGTVPLPHQQRDGRVTHLILVRHGETENIHFRVSDKDKRLTERGREQAAWTAKQIGDQLKKSGVAPENVTLIFGGLRRSVETAMAFKRAMPWLRHTHETCLLEEGVPEGIHNQHRRLFRDAMHRLACKYVCRPDPLEMDRYKILICHASLIQHLIARSTTHQFKMGRPIYHCSITQVDVVNDGNNHVSMAPICVNNIQHLPLTHRTRE